MMTNNKDELLAEQFPNHVTQILYQIIKQEGYISYDMTNTPILSKRNYLGTLHEVEVKGETKDGDKEIHLFIKLPMPINIVFFNIEEVYNTESYVYSELFKIYEELQNNADVPHEERFKAVKSYYGSSPEAIVLENLSRKGFKNWPRMGVAPLTFAELAIKQLAIFHALSLVLQNQKPEYFNSKVKPYKNFMFVDSEKQDALVKRLFDTATKDLLEESKKRLNIPIDTLTEKINKHLTRPNIFQCLCHGDFRNDNILYRDQAGSIKEVRLIDHQIIHYGSPVNDFMYFIFLETDRAFRRKHLDHLKNFYYTSLEQFLKYFDMELNDMWSRDKYENEFQECLMYGLIRALLVFPFTFADENDILDLEDDLMTMDMSPDRRCKIRIQELVDDFIEWRC